MSSANVVDSSAWLEYFTDNPGAKHFAGAIEDTENLLVPVVCLYEVFKKVLREKGEMEAIQIASVMQSGEPDGDPLPPWPRQPKILPRQSS